MEKCNLTYFLYLIGNIIHLGKGSAFLDGNYSPSSEYAIWNSVISKCRFNGDTRIIYNNLAQETQDLIKIIIQVFSESHKTTIFNYPSCLENPEEMNFQFDNMMIVIQNHTDLINCLETHCTYFQKSVKYILIGVVNNVCGKTCAHNMAKVIHEYSKVVDIVTVSTSSRTGRFAFTAINSNCTEIKVAEHKFSTSHLKVDFKKHPLIVGSYHLPPFMDFEKKWPQVEGIEANMLDYLKNKFNFTIVFVMLENQTHERLSNLSLFSDGMSIVSSPLIITLDRLMKYKFVVYDVSEVVMMLPARKPIQNYKRILKPFQKNVWYYLGIVYIALKIYNLIGKPAGMNLTRNLDIEAVFFGISVLFHPKHAMINWIFVITILFTFLIRNIYLGQIYKLIVSNLYELGPTSIKGVADENIPMGAVHLFAETLDSVAGTKANQSAVEILEINEKIYSISEGEEFGFVHVKGVLSYALSIMNKSTHDVYIVPEILRNYLISVMFAKNFPYVEEFTREIRKMVDNGLMFKWSRDAERMWIKKNPGGIREELDSLGIQHISGVLLFLGCGFIISLIVFIFECLLSKLNHNSR